MKELRNELINMALCFGMIIVYFVVCYYFGSIMFR